MVGLGIYWVRIDLLLLCPGFMGRRSWITTKQAHTNDLLSIEGQKKKEKHKWYLNVRVT